MLYKIETSINCDAVQRTTKNEFRELNSSRLAGQKIINNKIAYELTFLHDTNSENIIKSLSNLYEFAKNNYFESISEDDIKIILYFATYSKTLRNGNYDEIYNNFIFEEEEDNNTKEDNNGNTVFDRRNDPTNNNIDINNIEHINNNFISNNIDFDTNNNYDNNTDNNLINDYADFDNNNNEDNIFFDSNIDSNNKVDFIPNKATFTNINSNNAVFIDINNNNGIFINNNNNNDNNKTNNVTNLSSSNSKKHYRMPVFTKDEMQDINTLACKLLPEIIKQPDIAHAFIDLGGIGEIADLISEDWVLLCLATICKTSTSNRDEIFGFDFFKAFYDILSHGSVIPILDFEASCELAESLVEFEMQWEAQSIAARSIFPILYDWEKIVLKPCFLDAARKLIMHIEWSKNYNDKQFCQIFDIFPLLPLGQTDADERPMIPLMREKINVEHNYDLDGEWLLKSAKYIYEWLFYIGPAYASQSFNFYHVWVTLFVIFDSYFRDACRIASRAMTFLIQIDTNGFVQNQFHSTIVQLFSQASITDKVNFAVIISTAFINATNEQMIKLINEPGIFDVIFETLYSIEYSNEFFPSILAGLYRFVDFCGCHKQGMVVFKAYILTNTELEEWLNHLLSISSDLIDQNLFLQGKELYDLIHQRIDEYDIAMSNMNKPNM